MTNTANEVASPMSGQYYRVIASGLVLALALATIAAYAALIETKPATTVRVYLTIFSIEDCQSAICIVDE